AAAGAAIVAAGAWIGSLLPQAAAPLYVTREVLGWFEPQDAALFSPERFPVFLMESRHGSHYGFPIHGVPAVKVAKHHHRDERVDAATYSRVVTADDEALIRAMLAEHMPAANGRLVEARTCLYTMTPDSD